MRHVTHIDETVRLECRGSRNLMLGVGIHSVRIHSVITLSHVPCAFYATHEARMQRNVRPIYIYVHMYIYHMVHVTMWSQNVFSQNVFRLPTSENSLCRKGKFLTSSLLACSSAHMCRPKTLVRYGLLAWTRVSANSAQDSGSERAVRVYGVATISRLL